MGACLSCLARPASKDEYYLLEQGDQKSEAQSNDANTPGGKSNSAAGGWGCGTSVANSGGQQQGRGGSRRTGDAGASGSSLGGRPSPSSQSPTRTGSPGKRRWGGKGEDSADLAGASLGAPSCMTSQRRIRGDPSTRSPSPTRTVNPKDARDALARSKAAEPLSERPPWQGSFRSETGYLTPSIQVYHADDAADARDRYLQERYPELAADRDAFVPGYKERSKRAEGPSAMVEWTSPEMEA